MSHGRGGWSLAEYDWDPGTGNTRSVYRHDSGAEREQLGHQPRWFTPNVAGQLVVRGPVAKA